MINKENEDNNEKTQKKEETPNEVAKVGVMSHIKIEEIETGRVIINQRG